MTPSNQEFFSEQGANLFASGLVSILTWGGLSLMFPTHSFSFFGIWMLSLGAYFARHFYKK